MTAVLVFLLFVVAAVCAGIDAVRGRALTPAAVCLIAAAFAVANWPG